MKGAIFFSTKYGSTAEYATWIGEATNLPVLDIKAAEANLSNYDFLILGCPIIYFKPTIRKWVKRHLSELINKPIIFFTVSGSPAGPKLDKWISASMPKSFIAKVKHIALPGRQIPAELNWFDRTMLILAGLTNRDREAGKQELHGFDFMDKASIAPIVELAQQLQGNKVSA